MNTSNDGMVSFVFIETSSARASFAPDQSALSNQRRKFLSSWTPTARLSSTGFLLFLLQSRETIEFRPFL